MRKSRFPLPESAREPGWLELPKLTTKYTLHLIKLRLCELRGGEANLALARPITFLLIDCFVMWPLALGFFAVIKVAARCLLLISKDFTAMLLVHETRCVLDGQKVPCWHASNFTAFPRGRGYGRALMAAALEQADKAEMPVRLRADSLALVEKIYRPFGFVVMEANSSNATPYMIRLPRSWT